MHYKIPLLPMLLFSLACALALPTAARADAGPDALESATGLAEPPTAAPPSCPAGDHTIIDPAGVVTCAKLPPTAAAAPNPAASPLQAWDDTREARRTSWPLAIWLVLVLLGKALAYGRDSLTGLPVIGKFAAWLAGGKRAMAVAAIGAIGAAGYDVLIGGGTWVAALVASGAALGGVLHSTTKQPGNVAI